MSSLVGWAGDAVGALGSAYDWVAPAALGGEAGWFGGVGDIAAGASSYDFSGYWGDALGAATDADWWGTAGDFVVKAGEGGSLWDTVAPYASQAADWYSGFNASDLGLGSGGKGGGGSSSSGSGKGSTGQTLSNIGRALGAAGQAYGSGRGDVGFAPGGLFPMYRGGPINLIVNPGIEGALRLGEQMLQSAGAQRFMQ